MSAWVMWWMLSASTAVQFSAAACNEAKSSLSAIDVQSMHLTAKDAEFIGRWRDLGGRDVALCESVLSSAAMRQLSVKELYMLGAAVHGAADAITTVADRLAATDQPTSAALAWVKGADKAMQELHDADSAVVDEMMKAAERCP
jgi:hypothetical protein